MALRRTISRFEFLVALLLGLALLWRFGYFLEMYASPYAYDLGVDGEVFHEEALEVVAGQWTAGETFYQAPVYSRFLGVLYLLFGANPVIVKLIQIILGVASCWLISDIARRVFDTRVALLALAVASVYGAFIFFAGEYLVVTLFIFLSLLALDLLIWTSTRGRPVWWWVTGLAFGLAVITRGTILPFAVVVPFWILAMRWRAGERPRGFFEAMLFVFGLALAIAPVTLHNYWADGDFVLIASNDGLNFYIGNNPDSDGMTTAVVGMRSDQRGGTEDQFRLGREGLDDPTASPGAVSRWWFRRGLGFIIESPGQASRLTIRKAYLFVNAYEFGNNRVMDFVGRHSRVFAHATLRYWLILSLAAAGLVLGRGRSPQVFLLYAFVALYAGVVIAFVITARYRLPIVPVLIIFAAVAVSEWWEWITNRGWTLGKRKNLRVAVSVVVAVGVAIVARPSTSAQNAEAQAFFGEAEAYRQQGAFGAAATWYEHALEDYPEYCDAAYNLGRVHAEVFASPEQSIAVLQGVIPACADDLEIRRLLGLGLCAIDRCEEGIAHLRFVAERSPQSAEAHTDLERALGVIETQ